MSGHRGVEPGARSVATVPRSCGGDHPVELAGAEALEIERDEIEPGAAHRLGDAVVHIGGLGDPVGGDLDQPESVVVTYPDLVEAELPQRTFGSPTCDSRPSVTGVP